MYSIEGYHVKVEDPSTLQVGQQVEFGEIKERQNGKVTAVDEIKGITLKLSNGETEILKFDNQTIKQPLNPKFDSIPKGVYWAIVTLTTVGYGEIRPETPLGQSLAAMVMVMG